MELTSIPAIIQLLHPEIWFLQALAMALTALLLPGLRVTSIVGPVLAVMTLSFINTQLWSTALFFQIPDSLTVNALLLLVANGILFGIVVKLLPGIEISSILASLLAPIVFSISALVLEHTLRDVDWAVVIGQSIEFLSHIKEYFLSVSSDGNNLTAPISSELTSP